MQPAIKVPTQYLTDDFGRLPISTIVNLFKMFSTLSPVFSKNTTLKVRASENELH